MECRTCDFLSSLALACTPHEHQRVSTTHTPERLFQNTTSSCAPRPEECFISQECAPRSASIQTIPSTNQSFKWTDWSQNGSKPQANLR